MTTKSAPLKIFILFIALVCGATLRVQAAPARVLADNAAFNNSAEAGMLHNAYHILATGDHDYDGHRVKAMHAIEAAAKLLGMDLSGDLKDKSSQALSDDRLREAQGLIQNAMAAIPERKRIVRHLNEAVKQINVALSIH